MPVNPLPPTPTPAAHSADSGTSATMVSSANNGLDARPAFAHSLQTFLQAARLAADEASAQAESGTRSKSSPTANKSHAEKVPSKNSNSSGAPPATSSTTTATTPPASLWAQPVQA